MATFLRKLVLASAMTASAIFPASAETLFALTFPLEMPYWTSPPAAIRDPVGYIESGMRLCAKSGVLTAKNLNFRQLIIANGQIIFINTSEGYPGGVRDPASDGKCQENAALYAQQSNPRYAQVFGSALQSPSPRPAVSGNIAANSSPAPAAQPDPFAHFHEVMRAQDQQRIQSLQRTSSLPSPTANASTSSTTGSVTGATIFLDDAMRADLKEVVFRNGVQKYTEQNALLFASAIGDYFYMRNNVSNDTVPGGVAMTALQWSTDKDIQDFVRARRWYQIAENQFIAKNPSLAGLTSCFGSSALGCTEFQFAKSMIEACDFEFRNAGPIIERAREAAEAAKKDDAVRAQKYSEYLKTPEGKKEQKTAQCRASCGPTGGCFYFGDSMWLAQAACLGQHSANRRCVASCDN